MGATQAFFCRFLPVLAHLAGWNRYLQPLRLTEAPAWKCARACWAPPRYLAVGRRLQALALLVGPPVHARMATSMLPALRRLQPPR